MGPGASGLVQATVAMVMADHGEWFPKLGLSRPLLEAEFLSARDHCV